jgi:hypothetical protein
MVRFYPIHKKQERYSEAKHNAVEEYRGCGNIAPCILNLETRWN